MHPYHKVNAKVCHPFQNPSIAHRIQLLRQLVHLRGEPVLSGVDVSQIVWAEGTDAHISAEEEFSVSLLRHRSVRSLTFHICM
jgi:hypothetical protein